MIGSISKACAAFIVGNLAAKGVIRNETTVGGVLKELNDTMNPAYRNASVWQLLKHTAGIVKDGKIPYGLKASASQYRYAWAKNLLEAAPAGPLGEVHYSSGHEIVAVMCERLTGETYEALLARYVFQPCAMRSAGFSYVL